MAYNTLMIVHRITLNNHPESHADNPSLILTTWPWKRPLSRYRRKCSIIWAITRVREVNLSCLVHSTCCSLLEDHQWLLEEVLCQCTARCNCRTHLWWQIPLHSGRSNNWINKTLSINKYHKNNNKLHKDGYLHWIQIQSIH